MVPPAKGKPRQQMKPALWRSGDGRHHGRRRAVAPLALPRCAGYAEDQLGGQRGVRPGGPGAPGEGKKSQHQLAVTRNPKSSLCIYSLQLVQPFLSKTPLDRKSFCILGTTLGSIIPSRGWQLRHSSRVHKGPTCFVCEVCWATVCLKFLGTSTEKSQKGPWCC